MACFLGQQPAKARKQQVSVRSLKKQHHPLSVLQFGDKRENTLTCEYMYDNKHTEISDRLSIMIVTSAGKKSDHELSKGVSIPHPHRQAMEP